MSRSETSTRAIRSAAHEQIAADLGLEPHWFDLTLRKEILWESETATDAEVSRNGAETDSRDWG